MAATMPHRRFLTMNQVCAKTSCSRNSIYRLIAAGQFPKAVRLGPQRVGYLETEVEAWIDARVAERDASAA